MPETKMHEAIRRWCQLPSEEQLRISISRIPKKVAMSMAFEGEPVDEKMLEVELERLLKERGLSRRLSED